MQCTDYSSEADSGIAYSTEADRQALADQSGRVHSATAAGNSGDLHDACTKGWKIGHCNGRVGTVTAGGPGNAEFGSLVDYNFNDDGFNEYLRAANVEFVDDQHQRAHHLRRRIDDKCIGLRIGPDTDRSGCRSGGRLASGSLHLGGEMLLQLGCECFCVGVAQIAYLRIATVLEWRVEMCNQRTES